MKKIHRFIGSFDLKKDQINITDKDLVKQFTKVLRFKVEEVVVLCDGEGREAECEIEEIDTKHILLVVMTRSQAVPEPPIKAILFCAVLKRENFELVVQKATEVGVAEIVPILTERTVKQNVRLDRLQAIAKEAAEQSGRGRVPVVAKPIKFADALNRSKDLGTNYFYHTDKLEQKVSQKRKPKSLGLWIGPEGGWSDEEIEAAKSAGFELRSLGGFVLRAETAAIVAAYLVLNPEL